MKPLNLENDPKIKTGFTAPDAYFESFEAKVLERMASENVKVVPLYRRNFIRWTAAAAIVAGLALTGYFSLSKPAAPDAEAIETYIAYGSSLNQDDLINLLSEEDIRDMKQDLPLDNDAIEAELLQNPNFDLILSE